MRSTTSVIAVLCASFACESIVASQGSITVKPGAPPFVLPSRAANARIVQQGEGAVEYDLKDMYPAGGALANIQHTLSAVGWTPLDQDLWNPGLPSSNKVGWRDFVDGTTTPRLRVYQWLGYWRNKAGDVVIYGIRYKAADAALGSAPVGDGTATIEIFSAEALARSHIKVPKGA